MRKFRWCCGSCTLQIAGLEQVYEMLKYKFEAAILFFQGLILSV